MIITCLTNPNIKIIQINLDIERRDAETRVHTRARWSDCKEASDDLHDIEEEVLCEISEEKTNSIS